MPAGVTTNVRIVMNTTSVWVYWNNTQICTEARVDRSAFGAAQVYLSDPWHVPGIAQVANLTITNYDAVTTTTTLAPGASQSGVFPHASSDRTDLLDIFCSRFVYVRAWLCACVF